MTINAYVDVYDRWAGESSLPEDLKKELIAIRGDQREMEDRFYQFLSFGTGGMRGLLGAGTNRMNLYTIRHVAEGLALYIKAAGPAAVARGVAIAYDTRRFSKEFALETAKTIGKYGIRAYVFSESRPTPELSFAIRHLQAFAGVMITASHNPAEYNGYKVYGEDGGQLPPEAADVIIQHMASIEDLFSIQIEEEETLLENGVLQYVLEEIDTAYQEKLLTIRESAAELGEAGQNLSIIYTPLHGSGLVPVMEGLRNYGFTAVSLVPEQAKQLSDFPTVSYPNPEEREAFALAMQLGDEQKADLLLATDPDADRLGVAVRNQEGGYDLLSGNQLGALLLHYILMQKEKRGELPDNGVALKTIVTSEFGRAVAAKFGVKMIDTLTGFKFISEKIEEFEKDGSHSFLFGYEESYGYLIGDFARDKDAVQAALLTAEMAAYYKRDGKSLKDALEDLYEELGYYKEALRSLTLEGIEGREEISRIMEQFRNNAPSSIAGIAVCAIEDYKTGLRKEAEGTSEPLSLPQADVVKYILADGSWVCARPSGTEPKCKFYFGVRKETAAEADRHLHVLVEEIMDQLHK